MQILYYSYANIFNKKNNCTLKRFFVRSYQSIKNMDNKKLKFLKGIQEDSNNLHQFWSYDENLINQLKPIDLRKHFIDFCPNPEMNNILADVVTDKTKLFNQYTRDFGHARLSDLLSKYYSTLLERKISTDNNIVITMGLTEAIFICISGFIDKDDEVILITPIYHNCKPLVQMYNGIVHECPLKYDDNVMNWIIDLEYLKSLFNNRTKLIIFSNPNYLLGKVYTKNELEFVADLCKKWNVLCVVDESLDSTVVHSKHIRMATLPETWKRTLTIGGSGVTYGRTGWKVAWTYGHEQLINRIKIVHQLSFSSFTPVQETLARAIEKYGFEYFHSNYEENRDLLIKYLKKCGFQSIISPEGGYNIVVEISFKQNHQDVPFDYIIEWLISNCGILGVPIINYGNENKSIFFCFSFAQKLETIQLVGGRFES